MRVSLSLVFLFLFSGILFAQDNLARLQVIHNAADPAAEVVDVYVNGDIFLDDFAFRTATPFVDVPAQVELNIGVAPGNSSDANDVIATFPVTLAKDGSYVVVANGVLGSDFAENPDGKSIAFSLFPTADAREGANRDYKVDLNVFHGATDAPAVDVLLRLDRSDKNSNPQIEADMGLEKLDSNWDFKWRLADDLAYGEFNSYKSLYPTGLIIDITPAADNETIVASFDADLSGLGGGAAVVFASGFLSPEANSDGAAFGLFAALPGGDVVELPVIPAKPAMARLQVIHNAADPAAEVVDVYVNGDIFLDDFAFRTATPFVDVPAQVELNIGVAPGNSSDANDVIATFPVTLADDGSYVVVANGVLGSDFAENPDGKSIAFSLFPTADAREGANRDYKVDLNVFHGATDAPAVDVLLRLDRSDKNSNPQIEADMGLEKLDSNWDFKWRLADDLAYGEFNSYKSLYPTGLIIDITPAADNETIVASFDADLSGLGGGAAVVFASGFLSPEANSDGAAFGLFAALPGGDVVELPVIPAKPAMARLQVIHNAADPAAEVVDVYVNGDIFLDDFAFRTATPFVDVSAEVELNIGVAPGNSTDSDDIIATFPVTLADDGSYVVVANGVLGSDFAENPDGKSIAFSLFPTADAREGANRSYKVDLNVFHGSTDAPAVDVIARDVAKLVDDAHDGQFSGYLSVKADSYILDITPAADNETIVASFDADLSGLGGAAAVVFASGFLSPEANSDGAAFGLFAALPGGDVVELPVIPAKPAMARLQVIHNAADPAAEVVDVYVNGDLFLDDFAFRTATPFVDVPAQVELNIGVAPGNSSDANDVIATFPVTLAKDGSYVVVANGVLGSDFAENPDGKSIAFSLFPTADAREGANRSYKVDLNVFHGATDAPAVDVIARDVAKLVDDAHYGQFSGYLSVKADSYILDITPAADNETIVASFDADLSGLGGAAAVVFASGFLSPEANSDGAAFGLFAALPGGDVVELPVIPAKPAMARLQVIHNAADPAAEVVDVYVNGDLFLDDFAFRKATPFVDVPAQVELNIGVAPGNSSDANDVIATFPVTLAKDGSYVVVANGVLGSDFAENPDGKDIAFTLFATDGAREKAKDKDKVDLKVLHGATDAPAVNILGFGIKIMNAKYGDITDYLSVKARKNWLVVYVPDPLTLVGVYESDLSGLDGAAAFVFASGFVNPAANSDGAAFGLFAALPTGDVVELPKLEFNNSSNIANQVMVANGVVQVTSLQELENGQTIADFKLLQNYPNPFNPSTKISFQLPETANVSLKVYDINGRLVANLVDGMKSAGNYQIDFNAADYASGIYVYILKAGNYSAIKRMTLVK